MKVEYNLSSNFNLSIGLGFFDGVHLAHQKIIDNTVNLACENNIKSAIITFSKSPIEYLYQDKKIQYLTTNQKKIEILKSLGVDYLYLLDFNLIKQYGAKDYMKILYENFRPKFITTGFNNHFGKERGGNPKMLKEWEAEFGYNYFQIPPQKIDGTLISSTKIKSFIKNGDLTSAQKFLGRNFEIEGEVVKGNQLGQKIGFPTANLIWDENIVRLPSAVYRGFAICDGVSYRALINWGKRPTIDNKKILEVHLMNFAENIYGKKLSVIFETKLREQAKFASVDDLKSQIAKDYIKMQPSR